MTDAEYRTLTALGLRLFMPLDVVVHSARVMTTRQIVAGEIDTMCALQSLNWLRWLATVAKEMEEKAGQ